MREDDEAFLRRFAGVRKVRLLRGFVAVKLDAATLEGKIEGSSLLRTACESKFFSILFGSKLYLENGFSFGELKAEDWDVFCCFFSWNQEDDVLRTALLLPLVLFAKWDDFVRPEALNFPCCDDDLEEL